MPVNNGEPTHSDGEGNDYLPGSADLKSTISPESVKAADDAWKEHYSTNQQSNRNSSQFPNIEDPYSPLNSLIEDAFRRYGNMGIETLDGSIRLMMLRYANRIVEDVRAHPYSSLPALDYYVSIDETRPIPDEIVLAGISYYYAKWMRSADWRSFEADYRVSMNQIFFNRKYGSGKIEMSTIDKRAE